MKALLALLGLGYLTLEFWFNASLLNTLGAGTAEASTIHALEFVGKAISGVGLWLTLVKFFTLWPFYKRLGAGNIFLALPVLLILAVATMSSVQTAVTNYLAESSTPVERKTAYAISLVKSDIVRGDIKVVGFDFTPAEYKTAEGKTFVALFPAMSLSSPSAEALFSKAAEVSVKNLAADAQATRLNEAFHAYAGVRDDFVRQYNDQYLPASVQYAENGGGDPDTQWQKYLEAMDQHRINIDEYQSDSNRMRVIEAMRKEGVPLPDDWQLNDKETFIQSLGQGQSFSSLLQQKTNLALNVEAGLPWEQFAAHPDVVKLFNEELRKVAKGRVNYQGQLPLNLGFAGFEKRLSKDVDAAVAQRSGQVMKILQSPAETFADGKVNAETGREAVKALKAPVLALGISCLFAIINLIMVISSFIPGWIGKILTAVAIIAAVILPVKVSNTITSSPVFHEITQRAGPVAGAALTWITNAQPFIYPLANIPAQTFPFSTVESKVLPYIQE